MIKLARSCNKGWINYKLCTLLNLPKKEIDGKTKTEVDQYKQKLKQLGIDNFNEIAQDKERWLFYSHEPLWLLKLEKEEECLIS